MAAERWAVGAGFDYPQVRKDLAMLRKLLMDHAARNGISVIDFYGIYMEELKKKDASDLYIDGIHPTAGGHRILADAVQL
jgi:lysophospholipase L1-like esterase